MNNDREIHEEIKADEINTTFPHKRCYKKWPNLVPRTSPLAFGHGGEDKKLKKKKRGRGPGNEVVALQRTKRFNFNV